MARLREGDPSPILRLDARDIRFRFPGQSSWATEVHNRDEHARWLARFVGTGLELYPDEVIAQLADALGLVGTPEHCARRIIDLAGAGVSSLYLMGFQTFVGPEREMRNFRDEVFPRLKAAGCR